MNIFFKISLIVFLTLNLIILGLHLVWKEENESFKSYDQVLVKNKTNTKTLYENFKKAGFSPIYLYNQVIKFNDYNKLINVKYEDVKDRFLPQDQRVDPFVKKLETLFESEDKNFNIIYIKKIKNLLSYIRAKKIIKNLDGIYLSSNFNIENHLAFIAFIIFFATMYFATHRFKIITMAILSLPCLLINPSLFLSPLICSVFLFLYYEESLLNFDKLDIKNKISVSSVFGILFILLIYISSYNLIYLVSFGLAFLSLFCYSNLKTKTNLQMLSVVQIPIFFLGLIAFYFGNSSLTAPDSKIPVKNNVEKGYESYNYKNLERLSNTKERVVNAADFVSHMAFQYGYMLKKEYKLPKEGERDEIGQYKYNNNKIERYSIVLNVYDDLYLKKILEENEENSFTKIILEDEKIKYIDYKSDPHSFNLKKNMSLNFIFFLGFTIWFFTIILFKDRRTA